MLACSGCAALLIPTGFSLAFLPELPILGAHIIQFQTAKSKQSGADVLYCLEKKLNSTHNK